MVRYPFTPSQRFAARQRMRMHAAARRRAWLIALIGPMILASCVADNAAVGVGAAPPPPVSASTPPSAALAMTASSAATPEAFQLPPDVPVEQALIGRGPSFLAGLAQRDRMRATLCLASAIYYEAATEPDAGQRAVAQVVLNRVRHVEWPATVCGVVYQGSDRPGCQFSFACDGAMARGPSLAAWMRARRVAEAALSGDVFLPVGAATFYHTTAISPGWSARVTPVGIHGAHIFYSMPGDSTAGALPFRYRGGEPTPGPLPRVAPPAELLRVAMPSLPAPILAVPTPVAPIVVGLPIAPRAERPRTAVREDKRYVAGALPESDIRPEWAQSGQWIAK